MSIYRWSVTSYMMIGRRFWRVRDPRCPFPMVIGAPHRCGEFTSFAEAIAYADKRAREVAS